MGLTVVRFPDEATLQRRATAERRWSNVTFYAGVAIFVAAVLTAVLAPLIAPYDPNAVELQDKLLAPSASHAFGTDTFGRDIASRVIYAIRLDLQVIFIITYVPLVIGITVGAYAGYFGGWLDTVAMRLVDVAIALPFLVLMIAIVAIAGAGLTGVYIGVLVVGWALYARLTRGEMLVLQGAGLHARGRARARLLDHADRVPARDAEPPALEHRLLGRRPRPQPAPARKPLLPRPWRAASDGRARRDGGGGAECPSQAWWVATIPGLVIVVLGVGFSMIGDGLADRLGRQFRLTV